MSCNKVFINRIKRAEGQIKGVLRMLENDESCEDLVTQLKAIRATIDKTITLLTTNNLVNAIENKYNITLDELEDEIKLITKGV